MAEDIVNQVNPVPLGTNPRALAMRVGVTLESIYEAIRNEDLKAKKLGRRTIVLESDALEWLSKLPDLKLSPSARTRETREQAIRRLNQLRERDE
jgi:hypothetical protein